LDFRAIKNALTSSFDSLVPQITVLGFPRPTLGGSFVQRHIDLDGLLHHFYHTSGSSPEGWANSILATDFYDKQ
jgi:hypothetical protein